MFQTGPKRLVKGLYSAVADGKTAAIGFSKDTVTNSCIAIDKAATSVENTVGRIKDFSTDLYNDPSGTTKQIASSATSSVVGVCKILVGIATMFFPFLYGSIMNPPGVRALLHAKLDALLAEFDTVADHAAYGETLNDLDVFLLVEGRALIKEIFQQKLQERIAKKEQTQEAAQCTFRNKKRTRTARKRKT